MSKHSHIRSRPPADAKAGSCERESVDAESVARALAHLSPEPLAARATSVFFAFSDPTRFRMLEALSACEMCVCDLAQVVGVSQSGVSHQLRLLRDRGLVAFRRDGQRAVYRLSDNHVRDLITIGLAHAAEERP